MEGIDIIRQRFNYAEITTFRDYCRLDEKKPPNGTTFNDDIEDLDDFEFPTIQSLFKEKKGKIVTFPPKRNNRKTHYFHDNDDVQEKTQLNYGYINKKTSNVFTTTNDRHITNHYGRPLSEIRITTIERSIRRNGDKVTIKIYRRYKSRNFNAIYFKSRTDVTSITVNLVTGNFTTLIYGKSPKSNVKSFRTNGFTMLELLSKSGGPLDMKDLVSIESRVWGEYKNEFNNESFITALNGVFNLDTTKPYDSKTFRLDFIDWFIKQKKIKVSDHYQFWIQNFYPTEKFLKKNDRKLIQSILDMVQIKSKITIKLMHKHPDIDIVSLARLCYFLGENYTKYIGTIEPRVFELCKISHNPNNPSNLKNTIVSLFKEHKFLIKDIEKENIVRILNDDNIGTRNFDSVINDIYDHLNMIDKLREYEPNLYIKSKTFREFHSEHMELSKMMSMVKKGWVIEYQFADEMVNEIEKPLKTWVYDENVEPTDEIITIYPHILKREEEYDEEGRFMHHCVASYSNKERSIIVSLRNEDLSDRVTCEFDCQTGELIQMKSFCNAKPKHLFGDIMQKLQPKIDKFAKMGLLKSIEKRKVPFVINGVEVAIPNNSLTLIQQLYDRPMAVEEF